MTKASFALLIGAKIFLLMLFSFVAVVFAFFDFAVLLDDPLRISVVVFGIVITIFILAVSVYGLIFTLRFLFDPYKSFLAGLGTTKGEEDLQRRVEEIAERVEAFSPTLLETDRIPDIFSFGLSKDNSYVVASPSFLKALDDEEKEAVFLHETFHIKEDVEYQSFKVVWDKAINTPFNFVYALLAFGAVLLLFRFVFGGTGFPPLVFSEFETVQPILRMFGFLVILPFGLVLLALGIVRLWKEGTILSGRYLYIRELLADSYSAVTSGKPLKTYSAVVKATEKRIMSSFESSSDYKIGFAYSPNKDPQILGDVSLADIFKTKMHSTVRDIFSLRSEPAKVSCPIRYRLSLLKGLQKLIYENVKIIQLRRPQEFASSLSRLRMPETVVNLLREKKVAYREFYDYTVKEAANFNLIECANSIKVEPFEAFLMLYAAMSSGILDIKLKT